MVCVSVLILVFVGLLAVCLVYTHFVFCIFSLVLIGFAPDTFISVVMSSGWALDWATASLLCVYACLAFWVFVISKEKTVAARADEERGKDEDPDT